MGKVTDLMNFNYQSQVSDKKAPSNLTQIMLNISKISISLGLPWMLDIIKRELPADKNRYPGLQNLNAFLDVMSNSMTGMQTESTITVDQDIHKTR